VAATEREDLARAVELHKRGQLAEAIRSYQDVVARHPDNAVALNLLGLACFQHGDPVQGVARVKKALELKPDLPGGYFNLGTMLQALGQHEDAIAQYRNAVAANPEDCAAYNNLGTALKALYRHDEAVQCFAQAVGLQPHRADAHYNLANALPAIGRHDEAVRHYERAIALKPGFAQAHANLAAALQALGRHDEAVQHYETAVALRPQLADAQVGLGKLLVTLARHEQAARAFEAALAVRANDVDTYVELGNVLSALGRPKDAIDRFEIALSLAPNQAEARHNLGVALQALNRHAEAIPHYEKVIELNPYYPNAYMNLGSALHELNRHAEALAPLERALVLKPDYVHAHTNYASTLQALGRHHEAIRHFDQAIALEPDNAGVKFNKSQLSLALENFSEGWELYEHRWQAVKSNQPRPYRQPRWDGGKTGTLLVWGEQGLGDQILHSGMVAELAGSADRVVLEAEPRLVALFARSLPGVRVLPLGDALYSEAVDAQVPIASLGRHLRPSRDAFPRRERGYLAADAARAAQLRQRLTEDGRKVVGLSWISFNPRSGKSKSARLSDFESILRLPGWRFVDLQYGDTLAERQAVERDLGIRVERLEDIDNTNDIDGLAALITACDAVVTVSNTTAHLAGALGTPTWTLVPHGHSQIWYWFKDGDVSPWYAKVRVRRQANGQSWRDVAASCVDEIASLPKRS
jgi:tetratricopeptide (TPR) repeat protein